MKRVFPWRGGALRRSRWLLVLLGLVATFLRAETLTIATYNVQNYGPANRMTEDGFRPDYPKPEQEKAALRTVIRAVNADIWVLEEMGTAPYLEELRRDLKAEGCDYPYSALANAADAERHLAVLSRRPLLASETLALSFPYFGRVERVKRGVLRIKVGTDAGELTLFGLHLKSRLTERPDDPECTLRRGAEATAVRDAVLKLFPEPERARFVILGDCNDTKGSKTLTHLLRRGQREVSQLLPVIDSKGEKWTYSFRRDDSYTRIDHILIAPPLQAAVRDGTARIYDGDGVAHASDHRPVFVRLQLSP